MPGELSPELAGEGDQELVPAIQAALPCDALVEDAVIEIAVNSRLDAATQTAVRVADTLRIYIDEALGGGGNPVENRALEPRRQGSHDP